MLGLKLNHVSKRGHLKKYHDKFESYDLMGLLGSIPGLILVLRPANERRRYFVTTSLIGWVHA